MSGAGAEEPSVEALEALFVGNPDLERIEAHLNRFNPLKVMKVERMEIRHSAVLAWLLDPRETHGLGDRFLKAFLGEAFRGQAALGVPGSLDIARSDLTDAEVRCEWQNIDVFVRSPSNGWAFVIENKLGSKQHGGQLARYLDRAIDYNEGRLGGSATRGVFLTLNEEEPQDDRFVQISHEAVLRLLRRTIRRDDTRLPPEVAAFLSHYATVLAEATNMDDDRNAMRELARQLYLENKRVLDFVIEHGTSSDLSLAADAFWSTRPAKLDAFDLAGLPARFWSLSTRYFSFVPETWLDALGGGTEAWAGCEAWWAGLPVICFYELTPGDDGARGKITLVAEVGPVADHETRLALIGRIEDEGAAHPKLRVRFSKGATNEGRKYSRFFRRNSEAIDDVQDPEAISEAMTRLAERFGPEFAAVARAIGGMAPSG